MTSRFKHPTKAQINELPQYIGLSLENIVLVDTRAKAQRAGTVLSQARILGFDTETKPRFHVGQSCKGPALIQLATVDTGFLIPTRSQFGLSLASEILSNASIKKVGFGTHNDERELGLKFNIKVNNLENLSMTLKDYIDLDRPVGARAAVAMILKARLTKGAQKSNWEAPKLKPSQLLYAANDAHSALNVRNAISELLEGR